VIHRRAPAALANLVSVNRKVPLTTLEQELGFAAGPARGPAAVANLRPVRIPGTSVRAASTTWAPTW
jgi:hypothetical protein